jgi:hypothetical protein
MFLLNVCTFLPHLHTVKYQKTIIFESIRELLNTRRLFPQTGIITLITCFLCYLLAYGKKVKLSPYRPLGLGEAEAPTFSDIRLIDGGKVVSLTRRPLFTPRKFPGTQFC